MLENFIMPETLENDTIKLVARNNHQYDEDLWLETDKNRNFLRQFISWVDTTNSLQDCNSATDMFIDKWQKGENYAYSIVLKATGKAIGSIDIHNIDYDNYHGEIGYWLAEEYNGRGYMSGAVQLIENAAFSLGINRIEISTQKENIPSANVAKRNKYVFEGTLRKAIYNDGEFYDKLVFAKLKNA